MDETQAGTTAETQGQTPIVILGQLRRQLAPVMQIFDHEVLQPPDLALAFRGQVQVDTDQAYEHIEPAFAGLGYTAWLRDREGGGHEVLATKGVARAKAPRPWLNLVLFLATVVTVLYIGASYAITDAGLAENVPPEELALLPVRHLAMGIPFAATLLGILLAHELSHYFVSLRYGAPTSLPYFIPMPNILGTMGAVIVQRGHMRNRRAIFDIGIAGPLGGLVVAIPLLVLGLSLSTVGPVPANVDSVIQEGNSLLYLGLKYLVFGQVLPQGGIDVWLHPVAFAAWAGLLVTMINLIPVGQLDGGHVSYALLGRSAPRLGYAMVAAMVLWGGWLQLHGDQGGGFWLTWGVINLLINRRHPSPLNDASKLDSGRILIGMAMVILFVVLVMPSPIKTVDVQAPSGPAVYSGLAILSGLVAACRRRKPE